MPHLFHRASLLAALAAPLVPACKADIHDNTVTTNANMDFKIDSNVDVNNVKPGQAIAVTMSVSGAVLVDPHTTPPPNEVDTAAHFQIYLDDTDSDPILVTASTNVSVTVPASTPPGDHKLICRLHKHDGTPTDQEQEVDFKVTASASVSVKSPADAGTH
jgi:hypothetical protein